MALGADAYIRKPPEPKKQKSNYHSFTEEIVLKNP